MESNLIPGSKEIILKLNNFTKTGFSEDSADWAVKLYPLLDVTEILCGILPSLLDENLIKQILGDEDQATDFLFLRMKFSELAALIHSFAATIIAASGDKSFNDKLKEEAQKLEGLKNSLYDVFNTEKAAKDGFLRLAKETEERKKELEILRIEAAAEKTNYDKLVSECNVLENQTSELKESVADLQDRLAERDALDKEWLALVQKKTEYLCVIYDIQRRSKQLQEQKALLDQLEDLKNQEDENMESVQFLRSEQLKIIEKLVKNTGR